jgi:DNA-binding transcriptional ArsR family regulator
LRICFICGNGEICPHREPEVLAALAEAERREIVRLLLLRKRAQSSPARQDDREPQEARTA